MSNPAMLTCWTVSGDEIATVLKDAANSTGRALHQEKGKKSSFLLNLDDDALFERPDSTQIIFENDPEEQRHFFLGGFQIVSNAKQSKVYLTGKDGKESYLTTSKGIPYDKESGKLWYKAVCVVPGGPRLISRLRLEVLNVQKHEGGDPTNVTRIRFLKLTARIPDKTTATPTKSAPPPRGQLGATPLTKLPHGAGSAFSPAQPSALSAMFPGHNGSAFGPPTAMNPPGLGAIPPSMAQAFGGQASAFQPPPLQAQPSSAPPLTQDDLGAAMAGISMMARSTQESLEKSVKTQIADMQKHLDARWGKVEGYISSLTTVVVAQKTILEEKNLIMQQQQAMVTEQSKQVAELIRLQAELQSTIKSLQSDVKELQQQVGDSVDVAAAAATAVAESQSSSGVNTTVVLEAVAKSAIAEQQKEISPAIESIQTNMQSLSEYIMENQFQDDQLSKAIDDMHTDVRELKTIHESNHSLSESKEQEEKMSLTLDSIKGEISQLRQSVQDDGGKRDEVTLAIANVQSTLTKLEQAEPKVDRDAESAAAREQQEQHQALSASVKVLEADIATLRQSVEKTAEEGSSNQETELAVKEQREQHQALSASVKVLEADVATLRQSVEKTAEEGNSKQETELVVKEQKEQHQALSASVKVLEADVATLRQSVEKTAEERSSNQETELAVKEQKEQHQALSASVTALEANVATLRQSVEKTTQEGSSQQKALTDNLNLLKWDFSELQRSIQENAEDIRRQAAREETKPEQKEIVLTGIRDFPNDIFAIRSLEDADDDDDDDNLGDEKKEEGHERELVMQEPAAMESQEIELAPTSVPRVPRPLTPDRPRLEHNPVLKESLVLKQSIEALKEFREITNKDALKPAGSGDSASIPRPTLQALASVGSLVDNEEAVESEVESEFIGTDTGYGEAGEFIVKVETKDATPTSELPSPTPIDTMGDNEGASEKLDSTVEVPTNPIGSEKRNLGSLVVEPNGSVVVDVDEDGSTLDGVDLATTTSDSGSTVDVNTAIRPIDESTNHKGIGGMVKEKIKIWNEKNQAGKDGESKATESLPPQEQEGTPKAGKKVSFRDASLEDRYEYSPEIQMSASAEDSAATDETEEEGIFERGLKLFQYYSDLS